MPNKIYALCKAARKITDAELTELEGVAKQRMKIAPLSTQSDHNKIIRLVRELRDAVRAG